MGLLIFLVAMVSIVVGQAVGLFVRHWSAYLVAAFLGPPVGAAAFGAICYLTIAYDKSLSNFYLQGLGQSLWIGLMFTPFGTFLYRHWIGRKREATGESSLRSSSPRLSALRATGRPRVGSVPMAPRRSASPAHSKRKHDPEQIISAYGRLLAKGYRSPFGELPTTHTEIDELMNQVATVDQFTLTMGRSTKELPAPKDDIEAALRQALTLPRDEAGRKALAAGLVALADFQDIEWCKANNVDPLTLRLHDKKRLVELIRRLGVSLP